MSSASETGKAEKSGNCEGLVTVKTVLRQDASLHRYALYCHCRYNGKRLRLEVANAVATTVPSQCAVWIARAFRSMPSLPSAPLLSLKAATHLKARLLIPKSARHDGTVFRAASHYRYCRNTFCASAVSKAATRRRRAALISFIAALTCALGI